MGNNSFGQLGLGDKQNRLIPTLLLLPNNIGPKLVSCRSVSCRSVSCGFKYTMIIDTDDNIWVMGSNEYGELGIGKSVSTPTLLPTLLPGIKGRLISCGSSHTVILQ